MIVHEDNKVLGVGAEISAMISENVFEFLAAPISRLAGPEVPAMPFSPPMEAVYMISSEDIKKSIKELAEY